MNPDKNSQESSSPKSGNSGANTITHHNQAGLSHKSNERLESKPMTSVPPSVGQAKNHKVEGKNKKSLHHKQLQQPQQQQQQKKQSQQQAPNQSNRRNQQKNAGSSSKTAENNTSRKNEDTIICLTLNEFSKRAKELKADINSALEKQAKHQFTDQPVEVVELKNDILKLSGMKLDVSDDQEDKAGKETDGHGGTLKVEVSAASTESAIYTGDELYQANSNQSDNASEHKSSSEFNHHPVSPSVAPSCTDTNSSQEKNGESIKSIESSRAPEEDEDKLAQGYKCDTALVKALDKLTLDNQGNIKNSATKTVKSTQKKRHQVDLVSSDKLHDTKSDFIPDGFEPLNAKLDPNSKFVALVSSLQKQFQDAPHLLEPVCRKLVSISEQNSQLKDNCEKYQAENSKLSLVKQKLENLCRELQKSNNAIRIESLSLIKAEQGKAKEQTAKIQSTLSGVIKLFDENQQRNMSLRQENQELQTKLKSLLDHCDNWEKSLEAALRQRDIENRLIKTELAKANLIKNEEKEKFLGEKQELLHVLSMMQEQQHRIEDQEAKLRSDLSSYASKYDECQAVISKGMSRFQAESKRMLKQIEKSKQDYKALFLKYESCNKKTAQLLEEKKYWDKSMNLANKKVETLEKLCRALRERNAAKDAVIPANFDNDLLADHSKGGIF